MHATIATQALIRLHASRLVQPRGVSSIFALEQSRPPRRPIPGVHWFGVDAGETGVLQTPQTLPFVLFAIPARRARRPPVRAAPSWSPGAEALRALSLAGVLALAALRAC